jgi:putative Holliday junction resolvase
MTRIIALDVGEKRVGVAVTDPLGLTAQPLTVLSRKPHSSFLKSLNELVLKYNPQKVILGLPRRTTGELGPEAQKIFSLAYQLRSKLDLTVETYDERLTTAMALQLLNEAGASAKEKKAVVDKMAATIILEGYLAAESTRRESTQSDST